MTHYHICIGPAQTLPPYTNLKFEDYDESLICLVNLANTFFNELREDKEVDLTVQQALEATRYGESKGAYVGTNNLMIYWIRCEEDAHQIAAWN